MTRPPADEHPRLDRRQVIAGAAAGIACLAAPRLAAARVADRSFAWPDIGSDWTDGLPIANGDLGGMCWARGGDVVLSIDRSDVWDLRPVPEFERPQFTYANLRRLHRAGDKAGIARIFEEPFHVAGRGKLPLGRLLLGVKADEVAGSMLDVGAGLATVTLKDGTVITCLIAAEQPVGVVRATGPSAARIVGGVRVDPPPYGGAPAPIERRSALNYGTAADLGYPKPLDLSDDRSSGYATGAREQHFAVLARRIGDADAQAVVWTIATAPTRDAAAAQARATVLRWANARALARLERDHQAWWRAFWTRTAVSSDTPGLDRRWLLTTYHLGAAMREGKAPVPLQAPWTWDNGKLPAWKGDYHHDLNTQMTYWPVYAGNRPEMSANFVDWLWATRDAGFRFARDFYAAPGLNVPGTADILNQPLGGWAAYSYSPTTSAWLLHHFDLHWRYFGDPQFLRERAYPYALAVTDFLRGVLEERPGRSGLFLPLSSAPEINDNKLASWFTEWTNYDLALVRYAFTVAGEMAAALNDGAAASRHRAMLARLPDFARDEDGGFSIAAGTPLLESHRHFSHLLAFYPLRLLDPARDPAAARALEASLARFERLGTKMWMGYSFAWLASLWATLGRGDKTAAALATYEEGFSGRNGFHTNGDASGRGITAFPGRLFTLEGGNAACAAVQEMMLQGVGEDLRLFPAYPGASARFERLRAPDGVEVSARMEGGRIVSARLTAARALDRRLSGPGLADRRIRLTPGRAWTL